MSGASHEHHWLRHVLDCGCVLLECSAPRCPERRLFRSKRCENAEEMEIENMRKEENES